MKLLKYFTLLIAVSIFSNACDSTEIDTEKPSIDLSITDAFPTSCDTLYFDEPFTVKALLVDNAELGAYNIDIHHNFDHHTHSTEFEECTLEPIQTAVNPYVFIQDYTIPVGSAEYTAEIPMTIPGSDGTNMYDEGNYHFEITLTDKEGWSTLRGLNIKIFRR